MISHELGIIFIHIPKTAGVSLTHAIISQLVGYDTSYEIGHLSNELKYRFELRGKQKHKQAKYYVPEDIDKKRWDKYFKFAFVRNPWDRVISEFYWRQTLPSRHPSKNFKKFLNYCEFRLNDKNNKQHDIYWTHAQTQKSYVTDKNGNLILDKIYRFENLNDALVDISNKINIPFQLNRYNTSSHKKYTEYYDDETKGIVSFLYKEDIDFFNYEFGK